MPVLGGFDFTKSNRRLKNEYSPSGSNTNSSSVVSFLVNFLQYEVNNEIL